MLTIVQKINFRNLKRAMTILWERLHGLDFSIAAESEDVGYDPNVVHRSEPSGGPDLVKLLEKLNITDEDSIIDVGCGKGSAMRSMLSFPFKRVGGIEISEEIASIAKQNFHKLREVRTEIFAENATLFESFGDYNIFYFFSPFPCNIMADVIRKIDHAVKDHDRKSLVIYVNPECGDTLVKNSEFEKIMATKVDYHTVHVYSNMPE